ncbi:MAG TPA: xanthine dehydrogenase family protein subunit M [Bryobacteraceae bacterium]
MNPFAYSRPASLQAALTSTRRQAGSKFLGGGTNLVDLMKMGVEHPAALIDVTRLPDSDIKEHGAGVRIGAMARNSLVAAHPLVRERFPVLSQALLAGASPQIRTMATVGGNLLQRTRCPYFYDHSYAECNKRSPNSGCAAIQGYSRMHAILGGSERCIATHPSDMAVALAALDAIVQVEGPGGRRSIPMNDFHRLPGNTPQVETDLRPDELITAVDLPMASAFRSHYLKVRDRNSFAFALVSVAVMIETDPDNSRIREARIALGGVAPKPWRVRQAEELLRGKEPAESHYREAAEILVQNAKTTQYNAFKVELARRSIVRALSAAANIMPSA